MTSAPSFSNAATCFSLPPIVLEHMKVYALLTRRAAVDRFKLCIFLGFQHPEAPRIEDNRHYTTIEILAANNPPHQVALLFKQADIFDKCRNDIEDSLIANIEATSEEKKELQDYSRSFNRINEQSRVIDQIQKGELTLTNYDSGLLQRSSIEHSDYFRALMAVQIEDRYVPKDKGALDMSGRYVDKDLSGKDKDDVKEPTQSMEKHDEPQNKIPIDPIIEDWYLDPYNRHDPDGLADAAARRETLTTALRNRGFRGPRVGVLVSWLIRCKGRFRPYEEVVRPGVEVSSFVNGRSRTHRARRLRKSRVVRFQSLSTPNKSLKRKRITKASSKTSNATKGASAYPSPVSIREDSDGDDGIDDDAATTTSTCRSGNVSTSGIGSVRSAVRTLKIKDDKGIAASDDDSDESEHSPEHEAKLKEMKGTFANGRLPFKSIHKPGTDEYEDEYLDWQIAGIKRSLTFFETIYGDDLHSDDGGDDDDEKKDKNKVETDRTGQGKEVDHGNDDDDDDSNDDNKEDEVKFTYFRDADGLARPDVKYRTQGRKPSKLVFLKQENKEAWVEDETFGLTKP